MKKLVFILVIFSFVFGGLVNAQTSEFDAYKKAKETKFESFINTRKSVMENTHRDTIPYKSDSERDSLFGEFLKGEWKTFKVEFKELPKEIEPPFQPFADSADVANHVGIEIFPISDDEEDSSLDSLDDNQLVSIADSFQKIKIYFSDEYNKQEFAIVSYGYGLVGTSYLYLKKGNKWYKILMPVPNEYGIKQVCGIADKNDVVWIAVDLLNEEVTNTYYYNLNTKEFELLFSGKISKN